MSVGRCGDEFRAAVILPLGGAPGAILASLTLGGLAVVVFPRVVLRRVRLGVLVDDGHQLAHAHAVLLGTLELSAEVGEVGVVGKMRVYHVDTQDHRRVDEVGDAVVPLAGGRATLLVLLKIISTTMLIGTTLVIIIINLILQIMVILMAILMVILTTK